MTALSHVDAVVIGAGIAGASIGAELAQDRTVAVLEAEEMPGYHTTGRSAAIFIASYGNATICKLNRASLAFLRQPPPEFSDEGFLSPRGNLYIGRAEDKAAIDALHTASPHLIPHTTEEALKRVPILRPEAAAYVLEEPDSEDIDVARLHQCWLRRLTRAGGKVHCNAAVTGLSRGADGLWTVETKAGPFVTPLVVNAAGAWADEVAKMAGLSPVGLQPLRRTGAILPGPAGGGFDHWQMINDVMERFYFKPDAGKLLVSPVDEVPMDPHDAFVDDMDLAEGLYRFEQAVTLEVTRVDRSWAGLRTFAPDRSPVVGFDPGTEGFFWFAGQGGYGIQTCPAMAWLGSALATGSPLRAELTHEGFDPQDVAPRRTMVNRLRKH